MKFQCQKCETKYAIPEKRVVGRILKIRCKKCRGIVEVIGPPLPHPPGALEPAMAHAMPAAYPEADVSVMADSGLEHRQSGVHLARQMSDVQQIINRNRKKSPSAVWFAGIKGKRVGPLRKDELVILAKRGEITSRSYVWRPGMESWQRVNCGSLAFVHREVLKREQQLSQPRRLTGMESGVFIASGIFNPAELSDVLRPKQMPRPPEKDTARMKKPAVAKEEAKVEPPIIDLVPEAIIENPVEPIDNTGWFVVDEKLQQDLFSGVEDMPHFPGTTAFATGVHLLPRRRPIRMALAVVGIATLFGAGILFTAWLTRDGLTAFAKIPAAEEETVASYTPSKSLVSKMKRLLDPSRATGVQWPSYGAAEEAPKAVPAEHVAPVLTQTTNIAQGHIQAATDSARPKSKRPTISVPDVEALLGDSKPPVTIDSPDLGAPAVVQAPVYDGPADLTSDDVARVIEQRRPQLETCYKNVLKRHPDLSGTLDTSIVIGRNGKVHQVVVQGNEPGSRKLGNCMRRRMGRWTFPKPTSELEVVLPIRLKSSL